MDRGEERQLHIRKVLNYNARQHIHASVCTMSLPQLCWASVAPYRCSCPCVCVCGVTGCVSSLFWLSFSRFFFFSVSFVLFSLLCSSSSMKIIGPMSFVQQCVKSSLYNQVFLSSFLFLYLPFSLPHSFSLSVSFSVCLHKLSPGCKGYVTVKLCLLLWTMCEPERVRERGRESVCMCVYTLLLCLAVYLLLAAETASHEN